LTESLAVSARGKGLFKFDKDFKAYQGEILDIIRNPLNKAGKFFYLS
jgi:hypothetical protein